MEGDCCISCKGVCTSSNNCSSNIQQLQQRNNVLQKNGTTILLHGGDGRRRSNLQNTTKNEFPLMDGRPMNAVFGDSCPGTTKLLRVEYRFLDYSYYDERKAEEDYCGFDEEEEEDETNNTCGVVAVTDSNKETVNAGKRNHHQQQQHHRNIVCTSSRVFRSTFREHERVLLKRQDPLFHLITDDDDDGVEEYPKLNNNEGGDTTTIQNESDDGTAPPGTIRTLSQSSSSSSSPSKREVATTRTNPEITLPIILPYLTVRERARCQLVCISWRDQVQEQGVAKVVDVNDVELFPKHIMNQSSTPHHQPVLVNTPTNDASSSSSFIHHNHPSCLLRGLINQSHSSLESLVLNDFVPLQPSIDLHPALPFLRRLQRMDISRIPSLTDQTLNLISTCIGKQLEVLYMKGLRQISNDGIIHLVSNCCNLRVLDISEIHQLDDSAGMAIGRHLIKLEVLHAKDNYKLTNQSVDVITKNCRMLIQITLWGSILLKHVDFDKTEGTTDPLLFHNTENASMPRPSTLSDFHTTPAKLILLNLWGCHNLDDTAAKRLTSLPHLRSLCVSECHRLTDQFILGITESLPQLVHLQLRYVRRITDVSLEAISQRMQGLYSLDLSFCTRLTMQGICQFLTERCTSLSELRLYSCKQLNVEGGPLLMNGNNNVGGNGGRQLVQALKSICDDESTLSFLDVRECQQIEPFARDHVYVGGMQELGFDEIMLHGLFVRPARWNEKVRRQLVATLSDHSET